MPPTAEKVTPGDKADVARGPSAYRNVARQQSRRARGEEHGLETLASERSESGAEERSESPMEEASEVKAGIEVAGTGGDGKPGAKGGDAGHPQNRVEPTGAGTGRDGKGHAGGGAQARGGHAQNAKVLPLKAVRGAGGKFAGKGSQPNPVGVDRDPRGRTSPPRGATGSRKLVSSKDLGHYLSAAAK